jgi:lipoprotein-anchoring transpeptidase ErfK/SrfK
MESLIAFFISAMITATSTNNPAVLPDNPEASFGKTYEVAEPIEAPQVNSQNENAEPQSTPFTTEIPYYIKVNKKQNVVNVYTVDSNGEYSVPYKSILCSTGTHTPKTGSKYKITTYRRLWNKMQGGVYAQYAVQITGNILFHSVPYTKMNNSSLEYWEYDKLGTKASLGCIRMTAEDAKWVYDNIVPGTWVEFYEDDNPGPYGKPETMKISDNTAIRGWDPTDPNENNPWRNQNI